MSLYEPPRVHVADTDEPKQGPVGLLGALGIPWLLALGALYFVTPVLAEAVAISFTASPTEDLAAPLAPHVLATLLTLDLTIDAVFVAVATWWAITLSRLAPLPVALLYGFSLIAVRAVEAGGLPGIVNTGFPLWYDLLGNVNDLVGALAAALVHSFRGREAPAS